MVELLLLPELIGGTILQQVNYIIIHRKSSNGTKLASCKFKYSTPGMQQSNVYLLASLHNGFQVAVEFLKFISKECTQQKKRKEF